MFHWILGPIYGNEVLEELSDNHLLIFNLPTSNEDEKFIGAELKILTLLDVNAESNRGMCARKFYFQQYFMTKYFHYIGVKKILKVSVYDDGIKEPFHYQETQIHHVNNTWVTFDVTAPVSQIFQTSSKSKVLKITISVCAFFPSVTKNLRLSLMPVQEDFEHDYPVLLLSYSSIKGDVEGKKKSSKVDKNRNKRSLEDDYEEETNKLWDDEFSNKKTPLKKARKSRNTCRRKPLYINFSEINYDVWIVQPSGYDVRMDFVFVELTDLILMTEPRKVLIVFSLHLGVPMSRKVLLSSRGTSEPDQARHRPGSPP